MFQTNFKSFKDAFIKKKIIKRENCSLTSVHIMIHLTKFNNFFCATNKKYPKYKTVNKAD